MNNLHMKDLSEVDTSNTVFFELSNPSYTGDGINHMDLAYEYPRDKKYIIGIIKLAVRCGLTIHFHSKNEMAETWIAEYYKEYKS